MAYWLVKSDPETYSFGDLLKDKSTIWDGVRNYQARNFLQMMKIGDIAFVYHSQEGAKEIVGLAMITKEAFQDTTSEDSRWLAVGIKAIKKLKKKVSLSTIKSEKGLENISLIKQSRLSVMPISESEFNIILNLSGTKI